MRSLLPLATRHPRYNALRCDGLPDGYFEQEPQDWLRAVRSAAGQALDGLGTGPYAADRIAAVSVTAQGTQSSFPEAEDLEPSQFV